MIPPKTKILILKQAENYASGLKSFQSSLPVIMMGQLKLDRIDHKVLKEAVKLNNRQIESIIKLQGPKKKYQKRKAAITYRSYTVEFKKKLIKKIKQLDSTTNMGLSKIIRSKGRELGIHPKNIFRWFNTKQIKKKQGGRKAKFPEMQQRLAQFILNNPSMKRKHILRQAKKIMEELHFDERKHFNFSKGWYERFRQRLIRQKIIPGKISKRQVKLHPDDDYSESEFDQDSIYQKKEQKLQKLENQPKVEEGVHYYIEKIQVSAEDGDNDADLIKQQFIASNEDRGESNTFLIAEDCKLHYDQLIFGKKEQISKKQQQSDMKQINKKQSVKKQQDSDDDSEDQITNSRCSNYSSDAEQSNNVSRTITITASIWDQDKESEI